MTAATVTVVCDLFDGSGNPITHGTAWFAPSVTLTDAADGMEVPQAPVPAEFRSRVSPSAGLLATDNPNVLPSGWAWGVQFAYVAGNPAPYNFFLPAGPAAFTAAAGTPCVLGWGTTAALTSLLNGTGVRLSGGSVPAALGTASTYYIVNSSGTTVSLAASRGGTAIASAAGGSGNLTVTQYNLSALAPVGTAVTQFPANPMTAAGDIIYGGSTPAGTPQRLPIGSSGQALTVSGGLPAWATLTPASVSAAPQLQLIYADLLAGVDHTGATDSTAAIRAAQTAAGSSPYLIVLGAGTYKLGTSTDLLTFGRQQGLIAPGSAVCTIQYYGNGTCINAWDSSFSSSLSTGGRFGGFTVDGTYAGASAVGMRWGDLLRARCSDIKVIDFTGASSIGLYFWNVNGYSEEAEWTAINTSNCTTHVYFDNQSHDYSSYQFVIAAQPNQDGIRLENDASVEGTRIQLFGNFQTGVGNTGAVIAMDRLNPSTGTSRIDHAEIVLAVEPDGATAGAGGTGHYTILMLGSATEQFSGTGVLHFLKPGGGTGIPPFQGGTFGSGFGFSGRVYEPVLGAIESGDAAAFQGGTQWSQAGNLETNTAYDGMYIYPTHGDYQAFLLPGFGFTIAGVYDEPFLRTRKITVFLKQPASGGPITPSWPGNWVFTGSSSLSTAAGAVDRLDLTYLPSETTWYVSVARAYGGTYLLPVAQGGTGQGTASAAFNALSPLTTLGDILYASGANTAARLAGNTAATRKFLRQLGSGTTSAAPAWDTLQASDIPASLGATAFSGSVTPQAGIAPYTSGFTAFATGGAANVINSSSGASLTPVAGTWYYAALYVPFNCTLTGIIGVTGTSGGTDKWIYALWPGAGGAALANTALAGITAPAPNTKQAFPFNIATAVAGPGVYIAGVQSNGTAAKFLVFPNAVEGFVTGSVAGSFGTVPSLTPASTYTQNIGPFATTY